MPNSRSSGTNSSGAPVSPVVRVDDHAITCQGSTEKVLDVLFDGRRVWSFWMLRDGEQEHHRSRVSWPPALRPFLRGTTQLSVVEHVNGVVHFDSEVTFGETADVRVRVETREGKPLGLDKSNRLAQTFDTRSPEQVAPLLDSIETVLGALRDAGVEAFPAYGTLLGAVRGGRLVGHDSDADLGYVSTYSKPVDVSRESFRLQRHLCDLGFSITRYSGSAFKVEVLEADGSVRGLDVFGGYLSDDGHLILMGEIRTPFKREWIFPLGTTTLESRTLPAPADTDRFLTATYGPTWRVPDPAYHFETPRSTTRRLNGWFRGTRVGRDNWDRRWSGANRHGSPRMAPDDLTTWILNELPRPAHVVDVGCGRGVAVHHFAERAIAAVGLDYSPLGFAKVAAMAEEQHLPATYLRFNLLELRQVLAFGARLARVPGPRLVIARHLAENTSAVGRAHLWRFAEMLLRDGGQLVVEMQIPRRRSAKRPHLFDEVRAELLERGASVTKEISVQRASDGEVDTETGASRAPVETCRMVVEW